MSSRLLCQWQLSPHVSAPAILAKCLTVNRGSINFASAWRKKALVEAFSFWSFQLFAPKIRTVLPARLHVGKGESVRWGSALMLWCLESSCQHPDWCHRTPEVSGAVKTLSSRKSSPSVFLMLPLKSIVFIICFESLQGILLPSSTESKLMCTINNQTKIGRTRSQLHVLLAGKAVFSAKLSVSSME